MHCILVPGGGLEPNQPSVCKTAALPIELTRCRVVGTDPGTLRGAHDLESGAGIEPAISWVATRRHTNLTIRSETVLVIHFLCTQAHLVVLDSMSRATVVISRPLRDMCQKGAFLFFLDHI